MKEVIMQVQSFSADYPKAPIYVGDLVRCKDCKWQKFIDWGMGDCLHPKGSRHIAYDNHYCSYGERREE